MPAGLLRPLALAAALAGGIGIWCAPTPASATAVVALDLDALGREAELIVAGRVVSMESAWDRGRIRTRITLATESVLKGRPADPSRVTFFVLGGEVQGIAQWVPGEAKFAVGERVLVFLTDVERRPVVLGMAQGKWRWHPEARGAELSPDTDARADLELLGPDGLPRAPSPPGPVSLDRLRNAAAGGSR